jgi:hypothetical protein
MQPDRGDELERRWKELATSTSGNLAFDAEDPDEAQAVLERLDGLIAGFGALLRDTQDYGNDLKRDVRRRLAESALRERELERSAAARLARTVLGSRTAERLYAAEREAVARQSAELRRQAAEVKNTMRAREDEIAAILEQLRRQRQTAMEATAVCV